MPIPIKKKINKKKENKTLPHSLFLVKEGIFQARRNYFHALSHLIKGSARKNYNGFQRLLKIHGVLNTHTIRPH